MPIRERQAASDPEQARAIEAALTGIANAWGLDDTEHKALLRALKRGARHEFNAKRVSLALDIFEWLDAISRNLGGPIPWLRTSPEGQGSNLDKILSGRLGPLSEVHAKLAKHVFFGFSTGR